MLRKWSLRQRLANRLVGIGLLLLVPLVFSACYRDAGDNVQPTSNRVDLSDIVPTNTATPTVPPVEPTQTLEATPTTTGPQATPTRKLVPTTTPSDTIQQELATAVPTEPDTAELLTSDTTNTPQVQPSFTPVAPAETPVPTATDSGIATPGMSDIQPSNTPIPTLDPAMRPTPTGIPVEENPCIHVVTSGDTLFSIARDYDVDVEALVVTNPTLLGGNPNTILQIGWEMRLPNCELDVTSTPTPTTEAGETVENTPVPGAPVEHVVAAGEGIYSIARQYGVTPQAIIDANNLTNPNLIYPGQVLIIPAAQ